MRNFTVVRRVWFMLMLCGGLLVPAFAFEEQIEELATQIAAEAEGKQSIAVVDFTDLQGNVTERGRFLAEEFSVALSKSAHDFELVERTDLARIIEEHKLSQTGLIDHETAREAGKIAGVEALVVGRFTVLANNIRVTVKLLDLQSARVIASEAGMIPKFFLEGLDDPIPPRPRQSSPLREAPPVKDGRSIAKASGIKFELQGCKVAGGSLTCHLLVSSDEDIRLMVYEKSRVFDRSGSQYDLSEATLANQDGGRRVSGSLIAGVPARLVMTFEQFPAEASTIPVLEISCWRSHDGHFAVQLRNIPVQSA